MLTHGLCIKRGSFRCLHLDKKLPSLFLPLPLFFLLEKCSCEFFTIAHFSLLHKSLMLIKKPNVDMFCSHTGNNVKTLGFRNCVYEVITCLFWIPLFPSHLYNFHHEPNFGICQLLPNKLFCIILACLFFSWHLLVH